MRTLKTRAIPALLGTLIAITTTSWAQGPRQPAAPRGKAATAPPAQAGGTAKSALVPREEHPERKPEAPKLDPEAQARLDKVLSEWEDRSKTIQSLDAVFYRLDKNNVVGEIEFFEGRVMLQGPNKAVLDSMKLDLDSKNKDEAKTFAEALKWRRALQGPANAAEDPIPKAKKAFHERIICTGDAVLHYVNDVKKVYEYPLAAEDREAALQQGPLRFLFNMRKEEVLRRYVMRLVNEEDTTYYTLQVVPKLDIDRNAFAQAMVKLSRKTFLPDFLVLVDPNGNQQTYYLAQVRPNVKISEANFAHDPATWKKLGYELVKNPPPGPGDLTPPTTPAGSGGQAAPAKAASKGAAANPPAKKALR